MAVALIVAVPVVVAVALTLTRLIGAELYRVQGKALAAYWQVLAHWYMGAAIRHQATKGAQDITITTIKISRQKQPPPQGYL